MEFLLAYSLNVLTALTLVIGYLLYTAYRHTHMFLDDLRRAKNGQGVDPSYGFWKKVRWYINTTLVFRDGLLTPKETTRVLAIKDFTKFAEELEKHKLTKEEWDALDNPEQT